jgi:hypothetical protein
MSQTIALASSELVGNLADDGLVVCSKSHARLKILPAHLPITTSPSESVS